MFGLYILFDAEFNAVSEFVHGFELFNYKRTFESKIMFMGHFLGFLCFFKRTKQAMVKMKAYSESASKIV